MYCYIHDSWREDLRDEDGKITHKNVLFLRATITVNEVMYAFHAPIFDESEQNKLDTFELLHMKCRKALNDNFCV